MLNSEEQEELEELKSTYWTMSPNRYDRARRRKELEHNRWNYMVIEDLLDGGLEFEIERLNEKGLHIREGFQGFMTFEFCGEEYLLEFDSGREKGENLEFQGSKTQRTASYTLEEGVKNKTQFLDYLKEKFGSEFKYSMQ